MGGDLRVYLSTDGVDRVGCPIAISAGGGSVGDRWEGIEHADRLLENGKGRFEAGEGVKIETVSRFREDACQSWATEGSWKTAWARVDTTNGEYGWRADAGG